MLVLEVADGKLYGDDDFDDHYSARKCDTRNPIMS
jgi:hypothetical protein